MNVLFVCTGNVNRSFVAEKYLAKLATEAKVDIVVDSCGIGAQPYYKVPPQADSYLKSNAGVQSYSHSPKLITEELIAWADLILVMEDFQFDIISDKYPHSVRKMHLFLDYCLDKPGDLVDPMGKSDKVFLAAFSKIKEGVDRLFAKLITG